MGFSDNDNDTTVRFGAETRGLEAGTTKVSDLFSALFGRMNGGFGDMKNQLTGHVDGMNGVLGGLKTGIAGVGAAFAGVAALLAGGAIFSGAIQAASDEAGEIKKLINSLGMTAEAASKMKIALELVGMSAQDYVGIAMKFDRQLKSNERGLRALGVVTRDQNGSLLSQEALLQNATATMMTYKAGTDRNAFAMTAFGRSADEAFKLLELDDSIKKRADELAVSLGEIVTDKDLSDMKAYKVEMGAVGVVVGSFAENLGAAVIPALTELAKGFMDIAVTVMPSVNGAVEMSGIAFEAFADVVKDAIGKSFKLVSDFGAECGRVFGTEIPKDFKLFGNASQVTAGIIWGAATVIEDGFATIVAGIKELGIIAITTYDAIYKAAALGMLGSPVDAVKGGISAFKGVMNEYQAAIDANQLNYTKHLGYAEPEASHKTTGEREYRDPKAATEAPKAATSGDAEKALAEQQRLAEEAARIAEETRQAEIEGERAKAKSVIEIDKELLSQKLALGEISQEEYLIQTQSFEDRRYEIEKAALEDRKKLDEQDPTKNAARVATDYAAIEVLEKQHIARSIAAQTRMALQIRRQIEDIRKPWTDLFSSMSSGIGRSIGGFVMGTQNLATSLKGIYTSIQNSFADMLGNMVSKWIEDQLRMVFFKQTADSMNQASTAASAATTIATKSAETAAVVPMEGAKAASGAAASQASIPIVGPLLAAAAFATIMALVIGSMHSAEGGFDIPAGINPVTRLHSKEMVLPAQYADVIRGMSGKNGSGASGSTGSTAYNVSVTAMDGLSVRRFMNQHKTELMKALRDATRNGAHLGMK